METLTLEVVDKTPYGQSDRFGAKAFGQTCWWVCAASAERLAHLALIPRSSASRRFVFWMVLLLAFSVAVVPLGLVGWHTATNAPRDERSPAPTPAGRGWYHLAQAVPPPPYQGRAVPIAVWWNPTQAILAAASTFVAALLVACIILACQRAGAQRALGPKYRNQGRLEAALHYGTAWLVPMAPAAVLTALGRLADLSAAAPWPVVIPSVAIYAPAVVIALISVLGYSFGLIRVAVMVPVAVRTRVVIFLALWNPLMSAFWAAATAVGLYFWIQLLVPQLNLRW
ncbi:MAG: hypothetical protein V2A79_12390 [Planctomycetota bacterium]